MHTLCPHETVEEELFAVLQHRGRVYKQQCMRKICSTSRSCSTMILLACFVLLLCLSAYSEGTVISQEPGGSINLTCSFDGCPSNISGYKYLYLYYEFHEQEEVLFFDTNSPSGTPRLKYEHRIQTHRSTLTFTISNLTVNDTGMYRCVYKKSANIAVKCSVYAVFITGLFNSFFSRP
ncbi:hypothetical protein XENOCAPTIV_016751, partial [Xenoophorus captivus]